MDGKPFWTSKEFWANAVTAFIAIGVLVVPLASQYEIDLPSWIGFALALVTSSLTIVLRVFFTKEPLKLS